MSQKSKQKLRAQYERQELSQKKKKYPTVLQKRAWLLVKSSELIKLVEVKVGCTTRHCVSFHPLPSLPRVISTHMKISIISEKEFQIRENHLKKKNMKF